LRLFTPGGVLLERARLIVPFLRQVLNLHEVRD